MVKKAIVSAHNTIAAMAIPEPHWCNPSNVGVGFKFSNGFSADIVGCVANVKHAVQKDLNVSTTRANDQINPVDGRIKTCSRRVSCATDAKCQRNGQGNGNCCKADGEPSIAH